MNLAECRPRRRWRYGDISAARSRVVEPRSAQGRYERLAHPDPVGVGLMASLARPGGNMTGLSDRAGGEPATVLVRSAFGMIVCGVGTIRDGVAHIGPTDQGGLT